ILSAVPGLKILQHLFQQYRDMTGLTCLHIYIRDDAYRGTGSPTLKGNTVSLRIESILVFLPHGAIPDFNMIAHTHYRYFAAQPGIGAQPGGKHQSPLSIYH